jgi:hypothetical protein
MHTSKYGSSALTKSPIVMSNFLCSGLYDERVRYGRKEWSVLWCSKSIHHLRSLHPFD